MCVKKFIYLEVRVRERAFGREKGREGKEGEKPGASVDRSKGPSV